MQKLFHSIGDFPDSKLQWVEVFWLKIKLFPLEGASPFEELETLNDLFKYVSR